MRQARSNSSAVVWFTVLLVVLAALYPAWVGCACCGGLGACVWPPRRLRLLLRPGRLFLPTVQRRHARRTFPRGPFAAARSGTGAAVAVVTAAAVAVAALAAAVAAVAAAALPIAAVAGAAAAVGCSRLKLLVPRAGPLAASRWRAAVERPVAVPRLLRRIVSAVGLPAGGLLSTAAGAITRSRNRLSPIARGPDCYWQPEESRAPRLNCP